MMLPEHKLNVKQRQKVIPRHDVISNPRFHSFEPFFTTKLDLAVLSRISIFLPPATKLGQGNIFRSVCQEFCSRGFCPIVCWAYTPPDQRQAPHPDQRQAPLPGPQAGTPPYLHSPGTIGSACWKIREVHILLECILLDCILLECNLVYLSYSPLIFYRFFAKNCSRLTDSCLGEKI